MSIMFHNGELLMVKKEIFSDLVYFYLRQSVFECRKAACSTGMRASMMNIILSCQFFYALCVDTVNFTLIITKLYHDQQTPALVREPSDWEHVQNSLISLTDRTA